MVITGAGREFIIKDTHRGLWYEDGKLTKILEAGRYKIPPQQRWMQKLPKVECVLVDIRERDLTIKGQEILTADKVAIRVSILVQFRVTDAKAALHTVENYTDRLYSDVQLAARRSLASMVLEEILTNRNRLSEEIGDEHPQGCCQPLQGRHAGRSGPPFDQADGIGREAGEFSQRAQG